MLWPCGLAIVVQGGGDLGERSAGKYDEPGCRGGCCEGGQFHLSHLRRAQVHVLKTSQTPEASCITTLDI